MRENHLRWFGNVYWSPIYGPVRWSYIVDGASKKRGIPKLTRINIKTTYAKKQLNREHSMQPNRIIVKDLCSLS